MSQYMMKQQKQQILSELLQLSDVRILCMLICSNPSASLTQARLGIVTAIPSYSE